MRAMIASPEMAAWAGSPRSPWPDAASAAPPPTQKISANAASSSASARRGRAGRSGKDRLQWHADDLQPARQAVEREAAQVVLGDAQHVRGAAVAGRLQRLRHVREQIAQDTADGVPLPGIGLDALAQEPDPVADVARLVVVDLRIALDEARQQPLAREIVGGEPERRQAERRLEDQ